MNLKKVSALPMIARRKETPVSNWVTLVEKDVQFFKGKKTETYHCFAQADYVAVLARTSKGLIPVVRQFRPAVEKFTLELPGGLLDEGETPEGTCRRELLEEAGVQVRKITPLGSYYPDTGRLENRQHAFFAETSDPEPAFIAEPGMAVEYLTFGEIKKRIRKGEFIHQLHIGILFLCEMRYVKL